MYEKEDRIFAYSRSYGCQKLVLICNFSSKEKDIELSEDYENVVFVNYEQTTVIGNTLKMNRMNVLFMRCRSKKNPERSGFFFIFSKNLDSGACQVKKFKKRKN